MPQMIRVAVLIDADNISPKLAPALIAEAAAHGTLSVKRIYGDWTTNQLAGWKTVLPKHAIQPLQQFAYKAGKNATDSALIIDAMDLLYSGFVDTFVIISNDSDFTRLAVRLRESGKRVFGLGSKGASASFQNACDRFTFLEVIDEHANVPGASEPDTSAGEAGTTEEEPSPEGATGDLQEATAIILPAIRASADDDGWALLANVGWFIVNNTPTFDSRNYGFDKLSKLTQAIPAIETVSKPDVNQKNQVWVKIRETPESSSSEASKSPWETPD